MDIPLEKLVVRLSKHLIGVERNHMAWGRWEMGIGDSKFGMQAAGARLWLLEGSRHCSILLESRRWLCDMDDEADVEAVAKSGQLGK